ncbi:ALDH-like protein [Lecanosticta acicola]|uniref:ALDH-like protein n=1 Tax=Lecanosticta acicola TaxID=111012 RepID=A0AAI8Z8V5_9PEZI|nr:ALDH-like protein [Lecanosticta acicola]
MVHPFPRVEAAAIDGRLHTVYHRQVQLERLCKTLIENFNEIQRAIETDAGLSEQEIAIEYHQTLSAVKRSYALLKPKEAHEGEYLIANGRNAPNNRVPAGIVYIEPTMHTLFYSAIVPLAAAMVAGNCVVLLLENNLHSLSSLLRRVLSASLDADVFAVASAPVKDAAFLSKSLCVLQNGADGIPRINQITTPAAAPVVAVVDRTADLTLAARELVAARFAFGGTSPYAPDIILVNEFHHKDFLDAVVSESSRYRPNDNKKTTTSNFLATLPKTSTIRQQEPNRPIVDLSAREDILQKKAEVPILAIHGISSLDDAIDLLTSKTAATAPLLAAYHFCSPRAGKYLSQFIHASHTYINHIPSELLVGPAFTTTERYPLESFSLPRPVHITAPKKESGLGKKNAVVLIKEATTPLRQYKRHPGGGIGGVGFFEQGFLINALLIVGSTVTCTGLGALWLWRWRSVGV